MICVCDYIGKNRARGWGTWPPPQLEQGRDGEVGSLGKLYMIKDVESGD